MTASREVCIGRQPCPPCRLSSVVSIVAVLAVVIAPLTCSDCPAVDKQCSCSTDQESRDVIYCHSLGDISRVPSFTASVTEYYELKIDRGVKGTTVLTVQTSAFHGLKVTRIFLASIGITVMQPKAFAGVGDTLEYLSLRNNELETIPYDAFDELVKLKVLNLYANHLKTVSAAWLSPLSALEYITLRSNQLETIPDNTFKGLRNLSGLWLNNNRLTTIRDGAFNGLQNLKKLYLYNNRLKTVSAGSFSQLSALEILNLKSNLLDIISDDAFNGLKVLNKLYLPNNSLKTVSADLIANLPLLGSLYLYHNPLECDCRLAWVRTKASVLRGDTPLCASPSTVNGTSVLVYDISMCAATTTEIASSSANSRTKQKSTTVDPRTQVSNGGVLSTAGLHTVTTTNNGISKGNFVATTAVNASRGYDTTEAMETHATSASDGYAQAPATTNGKHYDYIYILIACGILCVALVSCFVICLIRRQRAKCRKCVDDIGTHTPPKEIESKPTAYDILTLPTPISECENETYTHLQPREVKKLAEYATIRSPIPVYVTKRDTQSRSNGHS